MPDAVDTARGRELLEALRLDTSSALLSDAVCALGDWLMANAAALLDAADAVQRVRALHCEGEWHGVGYRCSTCVTDPWPCPTRRALAAGDVTNTQEAGE